MTTIFTILSQNKAVVTMSKTTVGETGINAETLDSVEECETVAEVIDYGRWSYRREKAYWAVFNVFFVAFRDQCANYDSELADKKVASWLFDEASSTLNRVKKSSSERPSIVTLAWQLAEETDRRMTKKE